MASVNKVILIGNLGRDPEARYSKTGALMCSFSLACTEKFTTNGEKKERTEWVKIVTFGKLAELAEKYLSKGSPVYIEGRLQTREWEKDGVKRYTTEVVANTIQFLGGNDRRKNDPGPEAPPDEEIPF